MLNISFASRAWRHQRSNNMQQLPCLPTCTTPKSFHCAFACAALSGGASLKMHPMTAACVCVCVYIKLIANPFTCIFSMTCGQTWQNCTARKKTDQVCKYELALPESNPPFSSNPSSTASKSTGCCSICQAWQWQMACFILIGHRCLDRSCVRVLCPLRILCFDIFRQFLFDCCLLCHDSKW